MCRMVTTLALALMLSLSTMAAAGGENCDKAHADKASKASHAKTAMQEKAKHGWLGLDVEKDASGAYAVTGVRANSPAAKAGFQKGDVLVAMNGIALTDANKEVLKKAKMQNAVGRQVTYTISRSGSERQITATLAEVPKEVLAEWEKEYHRTVAVAQTDN
ncbi:MAG TPA: PDZ domain-containing protein [Thermoanaerobaculia bacterium]|nr:PDZ domain-containing protein [Thermoanaerobaculia bacterium]